MSLGAPSAYENSVQIASTFSCVSSAVDWASSAVDWAFSTSASSCVCADVVAQIIEVGLNRFEVGLNRSEVGLNCFEVGLNRRDRVLRVRPDRPRRACGPRRALRPWRSLFATLSERVWEPSMRISRHPRDQPDRGRGDDEADGSNSKQDSGAKKDARVVLLQKLAPPWSEFEGGFGGSDQIGEQDRCKRDRRPRA
jgi:hypothetical protein